MNTVVGDRSLDAVFYQDTQHTTWHYLFASALHLQALGSRSSYIVQQPSACNFQHRRSQRQARLRAKYLQKTRRREACLLRSATSATILWPCTISSFLQLQTVMIRQALFHQLQSSVQTHQKLVPPIQHSCPRLYLQITLGKHYIIFKPIA